MYNVEEEFKKFNKNDKWYWLLIILGIIVGPIIIILWIKGIAWEICYLFPDSRECVHMTKELE